MSLQNHSSQISTNQFKKLGKSRQTWKVKLQNTNMKIRSVTLMIALVKIGSILQYMTTFALATNSPKNLSAISWRKVEGQGRVTKHTSLFKVST